MEKIEFNITENDIGKRIDIFISENINQYSRSYLKQLLNDKLILLNNNPTKASTKLKKDDIINITFPNIETQTLSPQNIPLNILYEDEDIAFINKPKSMAVHPGAGTPDNTLVNALLYHYGSNLANATDLVRPGIVHRLDKDTTGVMVICKTDIAYTNLKDTFKSHDIKREYVALVLGRLKTETGTITTNIGRNPHNRLKMAVVSDGREAITHYKVIEYLPNYNMTYVKLTLETGRTHQIRVHMEHINHPIVGDPIYGIKKERYSKYGQFLHCATLGFIHPTKNTYIECSAPLPDYIKKFI